MTDMSRVRSPECSCCRRKADASPYYGSPYLRNDAIEGAMKPEEYRFVGNFISALIILNEIVIYFARLPFGIG